MERGTLPSCSPRTARSPTAIPSSPSSAKPVASGSRADGTSSIVQDYGGTKTEREIMAVLERGGVVGGSSAGATILGDFMVRGAPSNNNMIMDYPGYQTAFGYLRNVAIDQHVVARSRLPDLADSIITRYPNLLGISEDEGTAWVIRGDTGRIIGRSKGFVYNGRGEATDPGSPFVTLWPGDSYDLNARRVISRAGDRYAGPDRPHYVDVREIQWSFQRRDGARRTRRRSFGRQGVRHPGAGALHASNDVAAVRAWRHRPYVHLVMRPAAGTRGAGPRCGTGFSGGDGRRAGARKGWTATFATAKLRIARRGARWGAADGGPRFAKRALQRRRALSFRASAWKCQRPGAMRTTRRDGRSTRTSGVTRLAAYATADGKRAAFVRVPERKATIIILTNDANADARGMAEQILDRLLSQR